VGDSDASVRLRPANRLPVLLELETTLAVQVGVDPHTLVGDVRARSVDDDVVLAELAVGRLDPVGVHLGDGRVGKLDVVWCRVSRQPRLSAVRLEPRAVVCQWWLQGCQFYSR
jgi:hypothetical protein